VHRIKVVFFGDSFLGCSGLPSAEAWPAVVANNLCQHFSGRVDLEYRVRSGIQENTRGALERMQKDVQFEEPDVVVVQFGTNDSTHWLSNRGAPIVSQTAFRANLEEMIDRCRRFSIPRIIFVTSHKVALERFDINGMTPDQNTAIYDEITRGVAARATCLVADIRARCVEIEPRSICQDDLIHVNRAGAKLYADIVSPIMISAIEGLVALASAETPNHAHD
jgi:lysophospholipase L1-like esterase